MVELKRYIDELETENKIILEANRGQFSMVSSIAGQKVKNNREVIKRLSSIIESNKLAVKEDLNILEFKTQYTVDKTSEEDSKWEGVKEVEAFKDLGYEILKKGAFKKEMYSGRGENNGRTTYVFTVKILK